MEEKFFLKQDGVSVTSARFIVEGQTYAMNGVTSVKMVRKNPSRVLPIIFVLLGFGLFDNSRTIGVGVAVIVIAIIWLIKQKPEQSVILSSASGEVQALTSTDGAFIKSVIDALNDAIVYRG